jgi:hypothetical protein
MQASATEWPLVDPQYALNELRELPSFYKRYKIWTIFQENQKANVRNEWNKLNEVEKKRITSNALEKYKNAQNQERQRQAVCGN